MADKDKDGQGKEVVKIEDPKNPENKTTPKGEDPKVDPTPPKDQVDWKKKAEELTNENAGIKKLQSDTDKKFNTLKEEFGKMADAGVTPENAEEFKSKLAKAENDGKLLALKLKVGSEVGLPTGLIDRIKDGNEEEMKADAESIKKLVSPEPNKHEFSKEPVKAQDIEKPLDDQVKDFLAMSGKKQYAQEPK